MPRWLGPLCIAATCYGLYNVWVERPLAQPAGMVAPNAPEQQPLRSNAGPFNRAGWTIIPIAEFSVEARILGRERYHWDAVAKLAPIDLALGWGPMSDSSVLRHISIDQHTRYFHWRFKDASITPSDLVAHAANMHMIPADGTVERALLVVRPGQIVRFSGYLVAATPDAGGEPWRSSTSRTDTGNGACEIVWVTALRAGPS